jgi:hypothetical protein
VSLEKQLSSLKEEYDSNRTSIQKYFEDKNIESLEVDSENASEVVYVAKKIERMSIVYDVDKLKEKLDKEILSEILVKNYFIRDFNKLRTLMKKAGMSAKDFKECIGASEAVNKKSIEQLHSLGDITVADIKGCFTATLTKYVQIKEKKGGSD